MDRRSTFAEARTASSVRTESSAFFDVSVFGRSFPSL
jgi:hypothetical protein